MAHIDDEQRKLAGIRPMRSSLEEARQDALDEYGPGPDLTTAGELAKQMKKAGYRVKYDAKRESGKGSVRGFDIEFVESGNDPALWVEVTQRKRVKVDSAEQVMRFLKHLVDGYKEIE
jgi:hypothetical protein